jgi:N6-L-threonylcarbamoyladenine synthase
LVSGGNTVIAEVSDYTKFKIIGSTLDDAAGECFDKTARSMGLAYPGGVNLDKIATVADNRKYPLPFPKVSTGEFNFSFSGLKTAVLNLVHNAEQKGEEIDIPVVCATVRQRVCDLLIKNTMAAAEKTGYKTIAVAGGVSANSELRRRLDEECKNKGYSLYYPPLKYCGDNAAMVGAQAIYEYLDGNIGGTSLNATATLPINYR